MKSALAACMPILIAAAPVHAQSVEELEQQLEAQKQINNLTRQRVRTLEKQAAEKWDNSAALDARVGLPWGTILGIGAPYFIEADRDAGDNSGFAITPDITGNLGMSFSFVDKLEVEGINLRGSERTVGFLTLGSGFLIGKQHFLSFPANIDITDDAPDLTLGVSLPYRF